MNRLFVTALKSVGAVEDGDNPDATILLYKSHPENTESVEQPKGDTMSKPDISGLDPELQKAIDEYIAEQLTVEPDESEQLDIPADVQKVLDDKDAALAKERADRESLEEIVAKMRDEQLTERFTKRAGDLASVLGAGDDVPTVLKELFNAAPDAYSKLEALLADAAKIADTSDRLMLKELGTSNDESDPVAKINMIAKAIHTDERDEFPTFAKAKAEAWRRNTELKDESRQVN